MLYIGNATRIQQINFTTHCSVLVTYNTGENTDLQGFCKTNQYSAPQPHIDDIRYSKGFRLENKLHYSPIDHVTAS